MEPSRPQSGPAGPALPGHLPQGCPAITRTVFPLRAVSAGWGEGSQASPCGQFCTPSEGLTREKAWYGFRNRSQGFCQLLRTDVESEKNKTKGLHSQPNTVTGRFLKGEGGLMTRCNLRARAVALNVLLFTAVGSIGWLQSFLHFSEIHQAGSMPSHPAGSQSCWKEVRVPGGRGSPPEWQVASPRPPRAACSFPGATGMLRGRHMSLLGHLTKLSRRSQSLPPSQRDLVGQFLIMSSAS